MAVVRILALVVVYGISSTVFAANDELLSNPDFVQDTRGIGWPDGWGSLPDEREKQLVTENGEHFVRLKLAESGRPVLLYREVKLKPGELKGVNLSLKYRTDANGEVLLLFKDGAGRLLACERREFSTGSGKLWQEINAGVRVPENTVRLLVLAGLTSGKNGVADVAKFSLSRLDDETGLAPSPSPPSPLALSLDDLFKDGTAGISREQEGGLPFIRFVSQKPGESVMLFKRVALPKNSRGIFLVMKWRAEGIKHGENEWFDARAMVKLVDKNGGVFSPPGKNLDLVFTHKPNPTGWVEQASFIELPDNAAQLQMQVGLFKVNAGTFDLAFVQMIPLDDADVTALNLAGQAYAAWKGDQNAEQERRIDTKITAQLAATGNLVPNGNFAAATKNPNWPDEWGGAAWVGQSRRSEKENGGYFLRQTSNEPEKARMIYKMFVLPLGLKEVELSFRYRVSGVIRGDKPPGDARVICNFLDGTRVGHLESGKKLTPSPQDIVLSAGAGEWTEARRRFTVPAGATKLQFMFGLWFVKAGQIDLADPRLVPVEEK
jgi:hypothetical protein